MKHPEPPRFQIEMPVEAVLQPIEKATGLPNAAYTRASFQLD